VSRDQTLLSGLARRSGRANRDANDKAGSCADVAGGLTGIGGCAVETFKTLVNKGAEYECTSGEALGMLKLLV